ncbi:hypothetical protein [Mannheimia varigena]
MHILCFCNRQKNLYSSHLVKKTQKTPPAEIELALKRLQEMTDESTTNLV